MSLEFLRTLSTRRAPFNITCPDEVNNLVVLRAAGMVAAFTLRPPDFVIDGEVGRFLALTPEGRSALAQSGVPEASSLLEAARSNRVQS